ncbi:MAG: insulinase family protein [Myxococcota bacterium]|nr:insulinase family protein [Myxococcota bacterium]
MKTIFLTIMLVAGFQPEPTTPNTSPHATASDSTQGDTNTKAEAQSSTKKEKEDLKKIQSQTDAENRPENKSNPTSETATEKAADKKETATSQTTTQLSIPFEKYTLGNGLGILLHEDHTTPIAHVEIWYHVGSKDEPKGRSGFAHLFEHLMFNGSAHADGEYFGPLQAYGARINGTTNSDRTNYFETVPSHVLQRALWMEADRMGFLLPVLTQAKLDNQREVVLNEKRQRYEIAPYAKAWKLLAETMWPKNHPYHNLTIGKNIDLEAANLEDVRRFFNTWYTPNNATLVVSGHFNPDEVKGWIQSYFGPLPKLAEPKPVTQSSAPLPKETTIDTTDKVQLPRMYNTWRSPAFMQEGDAELDVLALILSQGKTSRLHKRLVYEDRIAKDVRAAQWSSQLGSTFNLVVTAAPGKKLSTIQKAVDEELARIIEDGPSEIELIRAKNAWKKSFYHQLESVAGKASMLQRYNHHKQDPSWIGQDLQRYEKVTLASLNKWLKNTLQKDHRITLNIRPEKK